MKSEITIEKCAEELGMAVGELRYLFENADIGKIPYKGLTSVSRCSTITLTSRKHT